MSFVSHVIAAHARHIVNAEPLLASQSVTQALDHVSDGFLSVPAEQPLMQTAVVLQQSKLLWVRCFHVHHSTAFR